MTTQDRASSDEQRGEAGRGDRHFDRGSWAVLGYALLIAAYQLALTVVLLA